MSVKYCREFDDIFPDIFKCLHNQGATCSDLAVYLFLAHHFCQTPEDHVSFSYKEMREALNISNDTLSTVLKRLQGFRLVQIKSNGGFEKTKYRPRLPNGSKFNYTLSDFPVGKTRHEGGPSGGGFKAPSLGPPSKAAKTDQARQYPLLVKKATKQLPDKVDKAVEKLWNAVGRENKLSMNSSPKGWKATLRKQSTNTQFNWNTFNKTLDWYVRHLSELRQLKIPEAYCIKSFLDKFVRIQSAMERIEEQEQEEEDNTTAPPPPERRVELTAEEEQKLRDGMAYLL